MKVFRLYSSEGCHLCEEALALCEIVQLTEKIEVIDIVDNEQYFEEYKYSIPVLERVHDNKKLYWPFNVEKIKEIV